MMPEKILYKNEVIIIGGISDTNFYTKVFIQYISGRVDHNNLYKSNRACVA